MAVIAANVTNETVDLISQILRTPEVMRFTEENDLNLFDNTILIRLALINFIKHIPTNDEVIQYKSALLRPHEFDGFWKQKLGVVDNVT